MSGPPTTPEPSGSQPTVAQSTTPQSMTPQPTALLPTLLEPPALRPPPLQSPPLQPAPTVPIADLPAPSLPMASPAPTSFPDSVAPSAQPTAGPNVATVFPFPDLGAAPDDATARPFAASSFAGADGAGPLTLERYQPARRSGNGPLDWLAFILAFLAPPIGLLLGIVTLVIDSRTKGFTAGITKAAVAIAIVLSVGLTVGFVVVSKLDADQAQHSAIAASSVTWCTKLQANPATLASDTYGWPSPGNTIPASIRSMKTYETFWQSAAAVAPSGIKAGTKSIATNAKSILDSVRSTQTLDDSSDISRMQSVVAASGIQTWVSQYCK
jgi:hypothetical protein